MQPNELDGDIEAVASTAHAICVSLREADPRELLRELMIVCEHEPARTAQVIMALAAWVDVDESMSARHQRVDAIATERVNLRLAS